MLENEEFQTLWKSDEDSFCCFGLFLISKLLVKTTDSADILIKIFL